MKPIPYSEILSSEELNKRIEYLQTLIGTVYDQYSKLEKLAQTQQLAILAMGPSMESAADFAGGFLRDVGFSYSGTTGAKVAYTSFWEEPVLSNNIHIEPGTGTIQLGFGGNTISRVPMNTVTGEVAEDVVTTTIASTTAYDSTIKWIFEEDKLWCSSFNYPEVSIEIILPPTLRSEINHIVFNTLFPRGNSYRIFIYDSAGNQHDITQGFQFNSNIFPVDGSRFSGRIRIDLKSSIQVNGDYVFGIRQLNLGYRDYVAEGKAISAIKLNHTAGADLTITSINAAYQLYSKPNKVSDAVHIRLGTGYDTTTASVTGVFYDSANHAFPFTPSDGSITATGAPDTIYAEVTLRNVGGTTPTVRGVYLEYTN